MCNYGNVIAWADGSRTSDGRMGWAVVFSDGTTKSGALFGHSNASAERAGVLHALYAGAEVIYTDWMNLSKMNPRVHWIRRNSTPEMVRADSLAREAAEALPTGTTSAQRELANTTFHRDLAAAGRAYRRNQRDVSAVVPGTIIKDAQGGFVAGPICPLCHSQRTKTRRFQDEWSSTSTVVAYCTVCRFEFSWHRMVT